MPGNISLAMNQGDGINSLILVVVTAGSVTNIVDTTQSAVFVSTTVMVGTSGARFFRCFAIAIRRMTSNRGIEPSRFLSEEAVITAADAEVVGDPASCSAKFKAVFLAVGSGLLCRFGIEHVAVLVA